MLYDDYKKWLRYSDRDFWEIQSNDGSPIVNRYYSFGVMGRKEFDKYNVSTIPVIISTQFGIDKSIIMKIFVDPEEFDASDFMYTKLAEELSTSSHPQQHAQVFAVDGRIIVGVIMDNSDGRLTVDDLQSVRTYLSDATKYFFPHFLKLKHGF